MRFLKHLWHALAGPHGVFSREALRSIQKAIQESERDHRGEIRFAVEAHLPLRALLQGQSPHQRALEAFSHLRVWDTEENNGVLIYLCLADKSIEIIADRGIARHVTTHEWKAVCNHAAAGFRQKDYRGGALQAIQEVRALLKRHFPAGAAHRNELPDRPAVI